MYVLLRRTLLVSGIAGLFGTLVLFAGCGQRAAPEAILFAQVVPLTGSEQAKRGVQLALAEVNKSEAKLLNRPVTFLHVERQAPDSLDGVVARLCDVNRVAGIQIDGKAVRVQPSRGVPVLTSDSAAEPDAGVFRTGLPASERGRMLARFAKEPDPGLSAKTAGVLGDGQASRQSLIDAFVGEFGKEQVTITRYGDSAELATIVAGWTAPPDVLLFAGAVEHLVGLDPRTAVLLGDDVSLPAGIPPLYLPTTFAADAPMPSVAEFAKTFQEHFQSAPDTAAANAYVHARLLFDATRKANALEGPRLRAVLLEGPFETITGPLRFDKKNQATRAAFIVHCQAGSRKCVKCVEANE